MLGLDKITKTMIDQLRGFSTTAKLLIGALMVILVMSLVFVGMLAGRTDMAPLGLGPGVGDEARAAAVAYLDSRGIPWKPAGTDIAVPVEQRHAVLAQLTESNVITADQIDFGSLFQDESPFTDRRTREARYLVAKMIEVERMIGAMDGIRRAKVVIDQPSHAGGLGAARIDATASVIVEARSGELTRRQADAVARIVAGAHAPLKLENVTVVDARTNQAIAARSDDDLSSTKYLETKLAVEKLAKSKIEAFLSVIPGVIVAVDAQVDATQVVAQSRRFEDPKTGVTRESSMERSESRARPGGPPGVRTNTGANLVTAGGGGDASSENRSEAELQNAFPNTETHTIDPRGYPLQINASVRVPKSYFLSLYREEHGGDATDAPDPAALDALIQEETEEIRSLVEPLIDTGTVPNASPGTVVVSMYNDTARFATAELGSGGGLAGGVLGGDFAAEGVVRTVALGALAFVSLLLMFMMVRRASRTEEMPTAEELVGIPPALAEADADVVGEVDETTAAMEGVEIEEGAVRRQQMVDQINDLALNASDEAASLLRKWIKTDS